MIKKKTKVKIKSKKAIADDMLDKALAASFPASDPISVETTLIPGTHPVKKKPPIRTKNKPVTRPRKKTAKRK